MGVRLFGFKSNVLAMLYLSDVYNPTRNYYLIKHGAQDTDGDDGEKDREVDYAGFEKEEVSEDKKNFDLEMFEMDFPPKPLPAILLNYFEIFMNVAQITNTIVVDLLQSGWFGLDESLQCYIPGRLAGFPPNLGKFATLLASCLHLGWKVKTNVFEKFYRIDVALFLLRDQGYINMHVNHACIRKGNYLVGDKITCNGYMRDILYISFKDQNDKKVKFILRPNRTSENWLKLTEIIEKLSIIDFYNIIGLHISLGLIALWGSINDMSYIKNHPGCTPELDLMAMEGKLTYLSVHLHWPKYSHRVISAYTDFFYSLFLIFEASVTTFTPTAAMILLCEDLMIYWRAIDKQLHRLLLVTMNRQAKDDNNERSDIYRYDQTKDAYYTNATLGQTNRYLLLSKQDINSVYVSSDKKMDMQIQVAQRMIIDFFLQLKYYDRLVSLGITVGFLVWAAIFVNTSYVAFFKDDFATLVTLNSLRIGGIGLVVSPLLVIVRLKKITQSAYIKINTLMAHEKVNKRKLVWLQILEFYNNKSNHYGFTLMHTYQVDWKLLLQLFGSSVSFIIVLETFKKYN